MKEKLYRRSTEPLGSLDVWEDLPKERNPESGSRSQVKKPAAGTGPEKKKEEFRAYEADARETVREFYRLSHENQTCAFAVERWEEIGGLDRMK